MNKKIEYAAYEILLDENTNQLAWRKPHKDGSPLSATEKWWWSHQKISDAEVLVFVSNYQALLSQHKNSISSAVNGFKRSIIYHRLHFIGRRDVLDKIATERNLKQNDIGWPINEEVI